MTHSFLSSEEYDERAHDLYNEGDYDGALETLKEGLALYPNAVELYAGLGHARLAREEIAWARLAFERALVLDPAHEDAMVGMGEVLLRLGRVREALELFREVEALGFGDDVELMLAVGRALYREHLFVEAKDVFTRLAAMRPDSGDAVAAIGYCLHRLGNDIEACRYLRRGLRIAPDLFETRIYMGHLLYDRGDWENALRHFERVPPQDHWDPIAVWRVLELKRSVAELDEGDPGLVPWQRRLDELEAVDEDPVDRLLAEVEAGWSGSDPWLHRDENQLELFTDRGGAEETVIQVRLSGGHVIRGTWGDVVKQFRDHVGFNHEPLGPFMRRMAERWHEQYGIEIPFSDPESFLRKAAEFGLLRLTDPFGREGD
ncbi:MAG: tetratricopeptide repeat protein [Gemmatimonadota bacterium]